MFNYIKNPTEIYRRSFEIIRAETDFSKLAKSAHAIATRIIHSCGMPEIVDDLVITENFAATAQQALANGPRDSP